MRAFTKVDFQPMEQFSLKWRWTEDEKWNILPPDDLARIFPLSAATASELFPLFKDYCVGYGLNEELFAVVSCFDDRSSPNEDVARCWMRELLTVSEPVVVLWSKDAAVLTDAEIFCRYWDDFCYPFDDVLILPPMLNWALFYFHEELFHFGVAHATHGRMSRND